MNTVNLFKSLADHFTLPVLQKKESTSLHDYRWEGTNIVMEVFMEKIDGKETAEDYLYNLTVDIQDFRKHCEETNDTVEVDGSFCGWFEGISWFDKQVEAESYADQFIAQIKADYAAWLTKKAI